MVEHEIILESRPVESIQDVIDNSRSMIEDNRPGEALEKIRSKLEDDGAGKFRIMGFVCNLPINRRAHK